MTSRGLDLLTTDQCLDLLRRHSYGRIGVKIAGELLILPVFYMVAGDEIVFRTDPGTKLIAAVLETRVAFEVDDQHAGWSVLVGGRAHEVRSPDAEPLIERLELDHFWPAGERQSVVRVEIERITGRRVQLAH